MLCRILCNFSIFDPCSPNGPRKMPEGLVSQFSTSATTWFPELLRRLWTATSCLARPMAPGACRSWISAISCLHDQLSPELRRALVFNIFVPRAPNKWLPELPERSIWKCSCLAGQMSPGASQQTAHHERKTRKRHATNPRQANHTPRPRDKHPEISKMLCETDQCSCAHSTRRMAQKQWKYICSTRWIACRTTNKNHCEPYEWWSYQFSKSVGEWNPEPLRTVLWRFSCLGSQIAWGSPGIINCVIFVPRQPNGPRSLPEQYF